MVSEIWGYLRGIFLLDCIVIIIFFFICFNELRKNGIVYGYVEGVIIYSVSFFFFFILVIIMLYYKNCILF